MDASEPPSSSTTFFSCAPARAATDRPAASDPVRVTAHTPGCSTPRRREIPEITSDEKQPGSNPAVSKSSSSASATPVTFDACLSTTGVAGHQCRCGEPDDLPEREVPRHHGEHHAERLVVDERPTRLGGDVAVGQHRLRSVGVVPTDPCRLGELGTALTQRLAHLHGHQRRPLVASLEQDLADAVHALARSANVVRRHDANRCQRAVDDRLDLGGRVFGVLRRDLTGRGVDRLGATCHGPSSRHAARVTGANDLTSHRRRSSRPHTGVRPRHSCRSPADPPSVVAELIGSRGLRRSGSRRCPTGESRSERSGTSRASPNRPLPRPRRRALRARSVPGSEPSRRRWWRRRSSRSVPRGRCRTGDAARSCGKPLEETTGDTNHMGSGTEGDPEEVEPQCVTPPDAHVIEAS